MHPFHSLVDLFCMAIGRLEKRRAVLSRQTGIPQPAINRRQQAADHRRQMRRELQLNLGSRRTTAELLDLAGVAMADDAIGRDAFRGLREQEMLLRRPSATTGARLGVDDLGCLMDSLSMILLTIPIFFPVITALDFNFTSLAELQAMKAMAVINSGAIPEAVTGDMLANIKTAIANGAELTREQMYY